MASRIRGQLDDWSPARITDLLRTGAGLADLNPDILAVMPFGMGGHVGTAFRAGSAFLVGDAAHPTTPVGGTGMNTAIHGAHNLGWKLAWVLRGWAGESLLASYELERRPIGTANVRRSLQRDPQPAANGLSWDIGVSYASPVFDTGAGAGSRAPHVWVRHRGSRISTLDLFDSRLTVITGRCGDSWRQVVAELAADELPIVALSVDTALHDDTDLAADGAGQPGTLAGRYHLGHSGAALIRPDGYVAWHRATATPNAREVLRSAVDAALSRTAGSELLWDVA
jgi:putative polyketide hydroxylase